MRPTEPRGTRYFEADNGNSIKLDVDYYPSGEEVQVSVSKEEK